MGIYLKYMISEGVEDQVSMDLLKEMMPEDSFNYNAERILTLLRAWKKSLKVF